ncbi:MAG: laccase domain-containing protein [Candidatus Andersenbacteria bacterium]|nr:laccase domain-containing protein [Candidatus Andersenbacteria bacterium]
MPSSSTNSVKVGQFSIETTIVPMKKANQDHSATIVTAADLPKVMIWDGIVVDRGEIGRIYTADCVPFVLVGEHQALAIHISRKNIVDMFDTIRTFLPTVKPTSAYVGPHICARHFTFSHVGKELESLKQSAPGMVRALDNGLTHVDLAAGIRGFLRGIYISPLATFFDSRCTYETKELPSYRRCFDTGEPWTESLCTTVSSLE